MRYQEQKDSLVSTFILTLGGLRGIGPVAVSRIIANYRGEIEEADLLNREFAQSLNDSTLYRSLDSWNESEEQAKHILNIAKHEDIAVLTPLSDRYPKRLLRNDRRPPVLFCKGSADALDADKAVAIIGTRKPTDFGARMGRRLANLLAEDGYAIVSGLALGCDTAGHEGALDVGGTTVALLPTPVDMPAYPKQNQELAERIVANGGALVSEYPLGTEVRDRQLVGNLIARDKWQPALSDGVIAIETSATGGTTHAMRHAVNAEVPLAVFDYRSRGNVNFYGDERFGGNVEYLQSGKAFGIFGPETIEEFKRRMDSFRDNTSTHQANGPTQLHIAFE